MVIANVTELSDDDTAGPASSAAAGSVPATEPGEPSPKPPTAAKSKAGPKQKAKAKAAAKDKAKVKAKAKKTTRKAEAEQKEEDDEEEATQHFELPEETETPETGKKVKSEGKKSKEIMKRPAASAASSPAMKKPAAPWTAGKSLYKRDGVWSIKLNRLNKEIMRVGVSGC